MADSTLAAIQKKVRRLTRSPSEALLTDTQLNEYINTFVLYDFPEQLKLFSLRSTFTFYTTANKAEYDTVNTPTTDPLYNFKNKYVGIHGPVYVAGYQVLFTQSREQFFALYPKVNVITNIGTGDGNTATYSGTLSQTPILPGSVTFASTGLFNQQLVLVDNPPTTGDLSKSDLVVPGTTTSEGTINYLSGIYAFTFPSDDVKNGSPVSAEVAAYTPGRPFAVLFYDNKFNLRPVPDQPYRVEFEVYVRPTELLESDQSPDLEQWWQYIAIGTALKIFEDRMDMDSVQKIMPIFKEQESFVQRRTLDILTNERAPTVYSDLGPGSNFIGFWPNNN